MAKRILYALTGIALILVAVILVRTFLYVPGEIPNEEKITFDVDMSRAARNLSRAIRFRTISRQPPEQLDPVQFNGFLNWMVETYPGVHQVLQRELIGGFTPLYRWQGREASLKPVLLTAHYDVVPVEPGTHGNWTQPPFEGVIESGQVWGRGALDDKGAMIAIFETLEQLIENGFTPRRTIYFSFGHDEEVGGDEGAGAVTSYLQAKDIQLAWTLDEGSAVFDGVLPGIDSLVASVNLAEKGYLTLDLVAGGTGGHSSMPPNETAVGLLAAAIDKLQNVPFPGGLDGISGVFFDAVGRHFPFARRLMFANTWIFGSGIETVLSGVNTTNAMLRTTVAPTMLTGSAKENVLPIEAVGTINLRIHPRDTIESAIEFVRSTIDDERIVVRMRGEADEPSPVSNANSDGFLAISAGLRAVYDDLIIVPGLTIAATDSKHYGKIADNSFRINPNILDTADIASIHGTNEHISIENLKNAILFYAHLIQNGM